MGSEEEIVGGTKEVELTDASSQATEDAATRTIKKVQRSLRGSIYMYIQDENTTSAMSYNMYQRSTKYTQLLRYMYVCMHIIIFIQLLY